MRLSCRYKYQHTTHTRDMYLQHTTHTHVICTYLHVESVGAYSLRPVLRVVALRVHPRVVEGIQLALQLFRQSDDVTTTWQGVCTCV